MDPGSDIRDGKNSDPGSGMEKIRIGDPGSGINIPDLQHWIYRKKSVTSFPEFARIARRLKYHKV
jgi:hypothetical protein